MNSLLYLGVARIMNLRERRFGGFFGGEFCRSRGFGARTLAAATPLAQRDWLYRAGRHTGRSWARDPGGAGSEVGSDSRSSSRGVTVPESSRIDDRRSTHPSPLTRSRRCCALNHPITSHMFAEAGHPRLRREPYWGNHFWARGYFVSTVGLNEDLIRRYVRYQEEREWREETERRDYDLFQRPPSN
jgi:hypothetical protein